MIPGLLPRTAVRNSLTGTRPQQQAVSWVGRFKLSRSVSIVRLPSTVPGRQLVLKRKRLSVKVRGSLASDSGSAVGVKEAPVLWPQQACETPAPGSFSVLITGSTKGLGRALAEEFLRQGDSVCVTSRSQAAVDDTLEDLQQYAVRGAQVCGLACDVREASQVARLSKFVQESLGGVDVWVNNAGSNGYSYAPLTDTDPEILKEIIDTNMYGTLLCTRQAVLLMRDQKGGGHIFNMEGAGSNGEVTMKYAAYGFSKAGMFQLAKSLSAECRDESVGVHTLSPGLVWTQLVQAGVDAFGRQGRFFINAVAEPPKVVASVMVPQIRAFCQANPGGSGSPSTLKFLTSQKALKKLFNRIVKGENANRFFSEIDPSGNQNPINLSSLMKKITSILAKFV